MVNIKDYTQAMYEAVKGCADAVYIADRPTAVSDKTDTFIVVDIPSYINNREMDRSGDFGYYVTTATIDLFVRDKKTSQKVGQVDIVKMDKMLKALMGVFPIKDTERGVLIYNPKTILSASDGNGFHYTSIQARLTTYF